MKRLSIFGIIIMICVSLLGTLFIGCQQQPAPALPETPTPQPTPTPTPSSSTPKIPTPQSAPAPVPAPAPTPAPAPQPPPASLEVLSLDIEPSEVMAGENVSIIVEVKNTGGSEGIYDVVLTLDGAKVATKDIVIAAGATEVVTLPLVKDSAGIYRLKLEQWTGVLIVKDQQGLPSGYIVEKKSCYEDEQIEIFDIIYMSDGLKVKGFLAQPKELGTYPAVIWNRGGNRDFSLLEPTTLKIYAMNGYVAIGSQYRGNGGGEGKEEFGGADVNDVLNLIPALKSLLNVDIDRIGMVGYSRGGMMTYIALKEQTLRGTSDIKAACTVGGVTDLFMLAEERPGAMLNDVMIPLIGGSPSQMPEKYEARSATYWADKINVPLLIQQGEADDRVSLEQAQKLAAELEKHGKVCELITYPDGDHGLSDQKGGRSEIFRWLRQYLR